MPSVSSPSHKFLASNPKASHAPGSTIVSRVCHCPESTACRTILARLQLWTCHVSRDAWCRLLNIRRSLGIMGKCRSTFRDMVEFPCLLNRDAPHSKQARRVPLMGPRKSIQLLGHTSYDLYASPNLCSRRDASYSDASKKLAAGTTN